MQAQLITYRLTDISQTEYLKQMVEPDAPVLAKVPGLISKVWLADEEKNTFGGFYLWENKTAMENFMHSDLVASVSWTRVSWLCRARGRTRLVSGSRATSGVACGCTRSR